jgi:hypothetical protein
MFAELLPIKESLEGSPLYTLGSLCQVRSLEEYGYQFFDFLGNFVPLQSLLDTGRYV